MSKASTTSLTDNSYLSTEKLLLELDPDLRILTYKNMVKNFNNRYDTLDKNSKRILKEYVNSITDSSDFKQFLTNESEIIKNRITKYADKIDDDVIKLKLNETTKLLNTYNTINKVNDNHVLGIMQFYELIEELECHTRKK